MGRRDATQRWESGRAAKVLRRSAMARVLQAGWMGKLTPSEWLVTPEIRRSQRRFFILMLVPLGVTVLLQVPWLLSVLFAAPPPPPQPTVVPIGPGGPLPPGRALARSLAPFILLLSVITFLAWPLVLIVLAARLSRRWQPLMLRERGVDACAACSFIGVGDARGSTRCPECGHENLPGPWRTQLSRRRRAALRFGPGHMARGLSVPGVPKEVADDIRLEARVQIVRAFGAKKPVLSRPWDGPPSLHPLKVRRVQRTLTFLPLGVFFFMYFSPSSGGSAGPAFMSPWLMIGMLGAAGLLMAYMRMIATRWVRHLTSEHLERATAGRAD